MNGVAPSSRANCLSSRPVEGSDLEIESVHPKTLAPLVEDNPWETGEMWSYGELLSPVGQFAAAAPRLADESAAIPHNLHIAEARASNARVSLERRRGINRQFPDQNPHRPPIGDDVMHRYDEHVIIFTKIN